MSTEALERFAARRTAAADHVEAMADSLDAAPSPIAAAEVLRAAATRARANRFHVVLVGAFSTGKSTLLNAIVGEPVLPVRVNPCTAILTELVHGTEPVVDVHGVDGAVERMSTEHFLETYQLAADDVSEAGREVADRFGKVDRAVVHVPLPLLAKGVVLVDTPGLDDDPQRTARTLDMLPRADAVIVVLNALRFLTELERQTIREQLLPLGLSNLFFPVTMADLLTHVAADADQARHAIRVRAREQLAPLTIVDERDRFDDRFFLLDARGALKARASGDSLEASGFEPFEDALTDFLVDERGRAQLERLYGAAAHARTSVRRQAQLDRASAAASVEELEARQAELGPRFDELERVAVRVDRTVAHFIERQKVRVWQDLRTHLVSLQEGLPDAIADMELPGLAGLDLLTSAGRARAEAALQQGLETWFAHQMDAWRESLRPKLTAALDDLRVELAAEAREFDSVTDAILDGFAGAHVALPSPQTEAEAMDPLERWFSVAVGAALLSPGTIAAAWTDGYEGALKGAAGRIGARVALVAMGALLGPVGWAGLVMYAAVDLLLVLRTGGGQLRRLRRVFADQVGGGLVAHADAQREAVEAQVVEALQPLREAVVAAARSDAEELKELLTTTITARREAADDAEKRAASWDAIEEALDDAMTGLDTTVHT
ncbi:MAG: dynamin family protein [Proteobacteria bacterium]|nr:dynamin family protein [Pseudomonadota bacterium]